MLRNQRILFSINKFKSIKLALNINHLFRFQWSTFRDNISIYYFYYAFFHLCTKYVNQLIKINCLKAIVIEFHYNRDRCKTQFNSILYYNSLFQLNVTLSNGFSFSSNEKLN